MTFKFDVLENRLLFEILNNYIKSKRISIKHNKAIDDNFVESLMY